MISQLLRSATPVLASLGCALLIWGSALIMAFSLGNWTRWPEDLSVPSAAEHYDRALQDAVEWSDDAHLTSIVARIFATGPASLTYRFESPSRKTQYYEATLERAIWETFTISSDSGTVLASSIERGGSLLDRIGLWSFDGEIERELERLGRVAIEFPMAPPIQRDDWLLDSVDAWNIAQENGGQEVLRKHDPPGTTLSIRVELHGFRVHHVEGVLVWRVSYSVIYDPDGGCLFYGVPGGYLEIWIDPKTGEVLQVNTR